MAKKTKLDNREILDIIIAELDNAPANSNLETPLEYYLGAPNGQEQEGRSKITSLDVADSIEWIMPQVMKSFTQTNEIVTFDPLTEDDELQAELESEYTYAILMKKNPGFIVIHQFIKDALMQRNGLIKVYFEKEEKKTTEEYTGLNEIQLTALLANENVEITSMSELMVMDEMGQTQISYDVSIIVTRSQSKICVESVAPENFRVNSQHNSIDLSNARFTAHIETKTISDLLEAGYSQKVLDEIPRDDTNNSEYRFNLQGESIIDGIGDSNEAMRLLTVAECYCHIDINGDGIAELVKVTCAGWGDNPSTVLSTEEVEDQPWISTTAILMSHKFQGLSMFDRLKEIQDHKTSLIRNMQDNIYLQNNNRSMVVEGQVNIDDMMVSRPGGIVRVKRLDAMAPIMTPQIGMEAFEMVRYLDEVRAGRSGVSAEGSATPQNIGNNVGSEGVERMMTAKEELVGLIIRVVAETGIKPLMLKIRDLARQHVDTIEDFKFRGRWVKVEPASWKDRTDSTVRVGTGSGDTRAKMAAIAKIMDIQAQALMQPGQVIVDQNKIYQAIDDFCKFAGLNGANKYFKDPTTEEGKNAQAQAQQQQAQEKQKVDMQNQAMMEMQIKLANAEMAKAQAAQANISVKAETEMAKHQREMDKQNYEIEKSKLEAQLTLSKALVDQTVKGQQIEFNYGKLAMDTAVKLAETTAAENEEKENKSKQTTEEMMQLIMNIVDVVDAKFEEQNKVITRPKTVVRDVNGKIVGVK